MRYEIDELLDFMRDNKVVALYLFEGLPPLAALPGTFKVPDVPAALIHELEGPNLCHDELKIIMDEIGMSHPIKKRPFSLEISYAIEPADYGVCQCCYSSRGVELDVALFMLDGRINLEFRRRGA
jgi:hypothetical protein